MSLKKQKNQAVFFKFLSAQSKKLTYYVLKSGNVAGSSELKQSRMGVGINLINLVKIIVH
ncbi:hypothetical protein HMPREF2811_09890 [Globicatella sp. HMSC072A10]|uniref:hypothetical protein n=1 Tax=Globicatella sp. HMSC072A10 TaxID=1739315 RepID=UPI0008D88A03|nr:hypothetical protein [Globicatella sp. HMSC072A10]OFK62798.1 hypothetical protein HMPREF2811_09890 [Globicatella sp. HMSC072A10]